jgi:Ni2+-binding GTPase involved in maturation of urease and hydrogenase
MSRVRFLMIGGFLGAGKTTVIARLARHFMDQGLAVGLVTNDQANVLVDTESLRAQGFNVGEVTGACFCCKFNGLLDTVSQISANRRPDIILAEPVGSCTDLVSTVVEPLKRFYGDQFEVGPLAVLVKPEHGRKILSGDASVGFSPKAAYIFLKQIEEADIVVVNKVDKLEPAERENLIQLVRERYSSKTVLAVSGRTGAGITDLVDELRRPSPTRAQAMDVDYDIYAEGEAELGWLNCLVTLSAADTSREFPLDKVVVDFVTRLKDQLISHNAEPAHLKVLAEADGESAIANLVSSDAGVDLSRSAGVSASRAELIVNARVAIAPETLADIVAETAAQLADDYQCAHTVADLQSFRPGRPMPTHRVGVE